MHRKRSLLLLVLFGLPFLGCGGRQACTGATSSYSSINAKIITPECTTCHSDMGSYNGLTGNGRIAAGNPSASPLYLRLSTGEMPKNGKQLCDSDIAAVSAWIQSGAANN